MNKFIFIGFFSLIYSFSFGQVTFKDLEELATTDREFSKMCKEKGKVEAFMAFCTDDAVLLRVKSDPVRGREAIKNYLETIADVDIHGGIYYWDPVNVEIADSGDLGYTYGIYTVDIPLADGNYKTVHGTYVTVWEKQDDGTWKFVIDSSNRGLSGKE